MCFVVISKVKYGLMVVNQMSGCFGCDKYKAHIFYLTQKTSLSSFKSDRDYHYIKGLDDILFTNGCRRYTFIKCMDGRSFTYHCNYRPDIMKCDIYGPTSEMQVIALQALKDAPMTSTNSNILVPSSGPSSLQLYLSRLSSF